MNYDEVTEALRTLAARDAGREAPARVEAALLSAFDRRQAARRRARLFWAAAAAAVVLVGTSLFWRTPPPIAPPVGRPFQAGAGLPPGAPAATQAVAQSRPVLRRVRRPATRQREIATSYIPLAYDTGVPADGPLPVVRMQLPRAVLVSFGLPMSPDLETETVDADVVLDNAGMARAIRFVR